MLSSSRRQRLPSRSLSLFFAVLLITTLAAGPAWSRSGAHLLTTGVVVDLARSEAYAMTPEGTTDAIELSRGSLLWSSTEAAKPLLAAGDLLFAQAEPREAGLMEVVVLDRGSAGARRLASRIELPKDLWASIDDGPATTFRSYGHKSEGEVYVSWISTRAKSEAPMQGFLPGPEHGMTPGMKRAVGKAGAPYQRLEGAARIDLSTGRASALSAARKSALAVPANLDLLFDKPVKGTRGLQYASADGRHVLVSERRADNGAWNRYRWTLYVRDTGELVGDFDYHAAVAPFLVSGRTLIFASRPFMVRRGEDIVDESDKIRAIDLGTGTELWSKAVRPTEFAGPFPP